MSDAILLRRLRFTPMRDLARGRVTGRLDLRARIAAATLPAPITDAITRILKHTRLRRSEKLDIADELIDHFADGLTSGATAEALVRDFGDVRAAAKLIRRAKRRNRPLLWRVANVAAKTLVAIVTISGVVYGGIYLRHLAGQAALKLDYVAIANAPILATPQDQRAWPIYREAILRFGLPMKETDRAIWSALTDWSEGDAGWPDAVRWLNERADGVALIRRAAALPAVGFVRGPGGDSEDPALFATDLALREKNAPHIHPIRRGSLNGSTFYYGEILQDLIYILEADARVAREAADAPRLIADITAMIQMGMQSDAAMSFNRHHQVSSLSSACYSIQDTLVQTPALLDETALRDIAHRISRRRNAAELNDLTGIRYEFDDQLQRFYTDDGHGDGRLTPEGVAILKSWSAGPTSDRRLAAAYKAWALQPELIAFSSRRAVKREFDALMDEAADLLGRPLRDADWAAWTARLDALKQPGNLAYVAIPLALQENFSMDHETVERYLGRRDGVVVAIALELYRRQHGAFPTTLDALVPWILPAIPADRITGDPVRYRLVEGRPLIYSVGVDRSDNGGRPRVWFDRKGNRQTGGAARWGRPGAARSDPRTIDGDWILYDGWPPGVLPH